MIYLYVTWVINGRAKFLFFFLHCSNWTTHCSLLIHFFIIFPFFTGEVQRNESLFNRSGIVNNAINYEPIFLEEIRNPELNFSVVLELCGDNKQCQYDYSVTGNEQIAKGTMKFIEKFKEIESDVQKGTELFSLIIHYSLRVFNFNIKMSTFLLLL